MLLVSFIDKNNKSINKYENEINIVIGISEYDINTKIEFLCNNDSFKELNNMNTELFFKNKKHKYQKNFFPKNEGVYNIKLKFNTILTDCSYMFSNCKNIVEINFINFNTLKIRNMYRMFYGCVNLEKLDLSSFNTKNVVNMSEMFSYCESLDNLDLSSFNTRNVTNMSYMFSGCKQLKNLNLSSFDTKNIVNICSMFYDCPDNIYESNKSKFSKFIKEDLINGF